MLKLGCTSANLANCCYQKSTTANFYPSTENNIDLLEKLPEDMVGALFIVFTRKTVLKKIFIRYSTNLCKSIVGIDAIQLYTFSICQAMPTGLYTRWEIDSEPVNFKQRQNKKRSFDNMVKSYFQQVRPLCDVENFYTTSIHKKLDAYSVDGFCGHCNTTVIEALGCYYQHCSSQEVRIFLNEEKNQQCFRNRELHELREQHVQKTVITSLRCTNGIGGNYTRQIKLMNSICADHSPTKCFSEKKNFWTISNLEVYLVKFNVMLKYPRLFEKFLPTSHPSSTTLMYR